jgi:hypothetical protein
MVRLHALFILTTRGQTIYGREEPWTIMTAQGLGQANNIRGGTDRWGCFLYGVALKAADREVLTFGSA